MRRDARIETREALNTSHAIRGAAWGKKKKKKKKKKKEMKQNKKKKKKKKEKKKKKKKKKQKKVTNKSVPHGRSGADFQGVTIGADQPLQAESRTVQQKGGQQFIYSKKESQYAVILRRNIHQNGQTRWGGLMHPARGEKR